MPLLHLPALQYKANIAITSLQVLGFGGGAQEAGGINAGYSKFADVGAAFKVHSRLGMVLLYSPALVVSLAYLKDSPTSGNGRERLTAFLLSIHFGKRVLESMLLHRYSGTMNGDFLLPISTSYALTAALVAHQQRQVASYAGNSASQWMLLAGIGLNAMGQLGNFYHHWLLAAMRPNNGGTEGSSKYVIPSGGMFKYVNTPHYFFELVAWLGIAFVTQHLNSFFVVGDMLSYLSGRSIATTRWYNAKFENYPAERKNLIPFIF